MIAERSADGCLEYRELDPLGHSAAILELLNTAFRERWSLDELQWKYLSAPVRPAVVFGAIEVATGRLAGVFSCALREYWLKGELVQGYQQADAAVHHDFRGRGVFFALLEYMTRFVREVGGLFHYGFTNDQSAAVMARSALNAENYSTRVFVRPLGVENVVNTLIRSESLRIALTRFGEPLVRSANRALISLQSTRLQLRPWGAVDEFPDFLARKLSTAYSLVPRRTIEYLTWRVFNAPLPHKSNLSGFWIFRGNIRVGYTVLFYETNRKAVKIIDLLCDTDAVSLAECIRTIVAHVLPSGADVVATNMAGGLHHAAFRQSGFLPRTPARCNVFSVHESFSAASDLSSPTWYLSPIDRDTFGGY
jgi:GNAT superfamily N-acetyltransferase